MRSIRWAVLPCSVLALGASAAACFPGWENRAGTEGDHSGLSDASLGDTGLGDAPSGDASVDRTVADGQAADATAEASDARAGSDAGGGDAEPEAGCMAGLSACGDAGVCVSLSNDVRNCGGCGNDCTRLPGISSSAAIGCSGGHCTYQCLAGYSDCADAGSGCISLAANPNCGACNMDCSDAGELCSPGAGSGAYACTVNCTGGTTLCGSTCVSETTNAQPNAPNCGGCGTQFNCTGGKTCQGAGCMCPGTQTDCGGTCTDTLVDNNNCGGCGSSHVCPASTQCNSGQCTCTTAGLSLCNGICVNETTSTQANATNCGGCGSSFNCSGGKTCQSDHCTCPAGSHDCGGTCSSNSLISSCGSSCTPCQIPAHGQATCDGTSCGMTCSTGLNVCGSGAGAACVNLQTDGTNCGACGHNCQNGGCLNGQQCEAALFATGFTGGPLAVGTDSIYVVDFGSGGRLLRILKSNGSITPIASGNIFSVAVFGSNVYWTIGGSATNSMVVRAALDGSSPQAIASSQVNAGAITADSSGAYWINGAVAGSDGSIMRFGPSDTSPFSVATGQPSPSSIATDANNVYWFTLGAVGDGSDGAVFGKPKSGGAIFTIASMQHNATGTGMALTTFGGTVFWDPRGLGNTDGAVRSAPPVASATLTEYANNQVRPQAIASDGSFVYWTDFGNGTDGLVQKASLTTKVVTQLAGSLAQPLGLGLDGSILYFSTFGNSTTAGGLYRLVL